MLKEHNVEYSYREYTKEPLTSKEIRALLGKLSIPANTLLRKRDAAYKELGLTGTEGDDELIPHFAAYPTLLQRPIAIVGEKAVLCRPADRLLELLD